MKKIVGLVIAACFLIGLGGCAARNDRVMHSVSDALKAPRSVERLDKNVRLYFGTQRHPRIIKKFGTYTSNKKTNALNKSDVEACQWVFLAAVLSLQQRAVREGGNAVVNIRSYYKKQTVSNRTKFMCGTGHLIAGVALRGDVVRLRRR